MIKHPAVEKIAVVPVDDKEINQAPVAFVVLSEKETDHATVEESLRRYAEANLEEVYRPKRYFFVPKYPLTKVGKVDYKALEQQAAELLG